MVQAVHPITVINKHQKIKVRREDDRDATIAETMEPLLDSQSALSNIRNDLNKKQLVFFDGIRSSVQMLDLAYRRLVDDLLWLSQNGSPFGEHMVSAFGDAWAIVDSGHRLRLLLEDIPNFRQNAPEHQLIIRTLRPLKELRDDLQHLDSELNKWMDPSEPFPGVWGQLSWIVWEEAAGAWTQNFAYWGSATNVLSPEFTVMPKHTSTQPVSDIRLTAFGKEANLSAVWQAVADWIRVLEPMLSKEFEGQVRHNADLVFRIKLAPAEEE